MPSSSLLQTPAWEERREREGKRGKGEKERREGREGKRWRRERGGSPAQNQSGLAYHLKIARDSNGNHLRCGIKVSTNLKIIGGRRQIKNKIAAATIS